MNITQSVQSAISSMPAGQIFGYQAMPSYASSPTAVIKAVGRLVAENKIKRLSKGQFYLPKEGLLGVRKPSDEELLRSVLYKAGQLRGYVTGSLLYNRLGLTTQIPRTVTVALNGARITKDFGTIRVKTVTARAPVTEQNSRLLQYLDVLKDIKKIPDADINQSLIVMQNKISQLDNTDRAAMASLAEGFYPPQVRALLCLLLSGSTLAVPDRLKEILNPMTTYALNLDKSIWPNAEKWNIR